MCLSLKWLHGEFGFVFLRVFHKIISITIYVFGKKYVKVSLYIFFSLFPFPFLMGLFFLHEQKCFIKKSYRKGLLTKVTLSAARKHFVAALERCRIGNIVAWW